MHITYSKRGLDIETVGNHPLVTSTQPASPEIALVAVVLHFSIPFLEDERHVNATYVHLPAMRMLLDACGGAPVTLHRCIDVSRDLCATYRAAAALGIDTVLTSGGAGSCRKGISQLAALLRLRDELDGPEVLIGAGVNAAVIDELRAALPGARAFHASCKTLLESGMTFRREGVPMGLPGLDEWHIQQTDADAVCAAKAAVMR